MVSASPAPIILVISKSVCAAHALAKTYSQFTGGYVCNPTRIAAARVKQPIGLPQLIGVRHLKLDSKGDPANLRHLILNNNKYDAALFLHVYPDDAHRVPVEYRQACSFLAIDDPRAICTAPFRRVWKVMVPPAPFPVMVYLGATPNWTGRLTNALEKAMISRRNKKRGCRLRPLFRRAKIHAVSSINS
jgi:hypothetical protein